MNLSWKKCMLSNHKFFLKEISNHFFKLKKALHGLKQALRAWYDRLKSFLIDNNFNIDKIDTIYFTKRKGKDILII
jgi:hypothetical protein